MGIFTGAKIAENRQYENPSDPANSNYSVIFEVTSPDAVIDPVTGEKLSTTLNEQANSINAAKKAAEEAKSSAESTAYKDFSVPADAWVASEDPAFPFTAEIVDEAVTADHIAHFVFDKASILAAMEAVILTGDTAEGKITLLAKVAPTVELSGAYKITQRKGAD